MERISHFEIVRRLGQGGMGEVHEAVDLDLGRRVALKFVSGTNAHDPEALRRFEREARTAAALQHPHIATLFAFDRSTERPFLVMELLAGRTLRDVLAAGPLPMPDALGIVRDVAAALAYAHRHSVVHRDIKPENLMFDADGRVKVTDFGLARMTDASRLTRTGSTLGTPFYMAPELVRGTSSPGAESEDVGAAPADVFALGVTLYEMLTGTLPFRGPNALATLYAIAHDDAPPLRERRADAPPEVEALLARMLARDPAARPDAAEVASALGGVTGEAPAGGWASGVSRAFAPAEPVQSGAVTREMGGATTSAVTLPVERRPAAQAGLPVPAGGLVRRPRRGARLGAALAVIAAVGAAITWGVFARNAAASRRAVSLNNQGHDSLMAGRVEVAKARFEAALAIAPRYAEAKLNLAAVLARAGSADRAAQRYAEVLRENPRRPGLLAAAHYGLGELDLRAHAWPGAVAHLQEASRLDSTRAEYPNNLGYALVQAGRTAEALSTLRAAQARFPAEPAPLKNIALAWLAGGAPDSGLVAADRAVRLRPTFAAGWLAKLQCEAALGERTAALASLETLRGLSPTDAELAEALTAIRGIAAVRATQRRLPAR
ncbi:MAG: protein kinase [Candidatus Eisenbacteria bacterium]|nr:protein kinase [Candidatus Eisenbacteria bacterium]